MAVLAYRSIASPSPAPPPPPVPTTRPSAAFIAGRDAPGFTPVRPPAGSVTIVEPAPPSAGVPTWVWVVGAMLLTTGLLYLIWYLATPRYACRASSDSNNNNTATCTRVGNPFYSGTTYGDESACSTVCAVTTTVSSATSTTFMPSTSS